MPTNLGNLVPGATGLYVPFNTHTPAGVPITLVGGAVKAYKGLDTVGTDAGLTLVVDHYTIGTHSIKLDLSDAYYDADNDYTLMLTAGTVDGVSVLGTVIAYFSVLNQRGSNVARWLDNDAQSATSIDGTTILPRVFIHAGDDESAMVNILQTLAIFEAFGIVLEVTGAITDTLVPVSGDTTFRSASGRTLSPQALVGDAPLWELQDSGIPEGVPMYYSAAGLLGAYAAMPGYSGTITVALSVRPKVALDWSADVSSKPTIPTASDNAAAVAAQPTGATQGSIGFAAGSAASDAASLKTTIGTAGSGLTNLGDARLGRIPDYKPTVDGTGKTVMQGAWSDISGTPTIGTSTLTTSDIDARLTAFPVQKSGVAVTLPTTAPAGYGGDTAANIATAVWDMLLSTTRVASSFGARLKAWILGTEAIPAATLANAPTSAPSTTVVVDQQPITPGQLACYQGGAFVNPGAGTPLSFAVVDTDGDPISLADKTLIAQVTNSQDINSVRWTWGTADGTLTVAGADHNLVQINADSTHSQSAGTFALFLWDVTSGEPEAIPEASLILSILPAPVPVIPE